MIAVRYFLIGITLALLLLADLLAGALRSGGMRRVVGIALGLTAAVGVQSSTFFSHSLHVFASTMASIFYLTNRYAAPTEWINDVGPVFILIILAVLVPCCLSDIAFPVLMSRSARKQYLTHGHVH